MSDIAYRIGGRDFRRFGLAPVTVLEISGGQRAFSDHDAVRNSQKLRIGELDAGPRVAIIEQDIDACGVEIPVQRICRLLNPRRLLIVDGHQYYLEGRNRLRPYDPVAIVILFDGRSDHPRYADAIAAHEHRQGLALFIQHAGVHGCAVEPAELKYVAHLDAAGDLQVSASGRPGIAGLSIADVDRLRIGEVAAPIHTSIVHILFVRAADEIGQVSRGMVHVDLALETYGPDETRFRAARRADAFGAGHSQRARNPVQFLRFYGVEFMIAANDQSDHIAVAAFHQQGLDALRGTHAEQRADFSNGAGVRRGYFSQRLRRRRAGRGRA